MSERFGIVGVFATPEAIRQAGERLHAMGFRAVDAYTPYPVEELSELEQPRRGVLLPAVMAVAAAAGAACGYFIQYWGEALAYPLNVGGRPYDSWPAFTVSTFELMLLFAVAAGFVALLVVCRLPQLYHPLFAAEEFVRVSRDRFVLCVEAGDPGFEPSVIRRVFERHGAERIEELSA